VREKVEGLAELGRDMWRSVKESWLSLIPPIAAKAIAKLLAKFVPGAGWVTPLIDMVGFLIDKGRQILQFLTTVKDAFVLVVRGGANLIDRVGERVSEVMTRALPILFAGLASIFGLGSVPRRLRRGLETVRETAQRPLKRIIEIVARPVRAVLDRIFRAITGARPLRKPVEVRSGNKTVKVWPEQDRFGRIRIVAASSPKRHLPPNDPNVKKAVKANEEFAREQQRAVSGTGGPQAAEKSAQAAERADRLQSEIDVTPSPFEDLLIPLGHEPASDPDDPSEPVPAQILDSIPTHPQDSRYPSGSRALGILVVAGFKFYLRSGETRDFESYGGRDYQNFVGDLPQIIAFGHGFQHRHNHVEGSAAAIMRFMMIHLRETNLRGVLYINLPPCQGRRDRKPGCAHVLNEMLPEGAHLTVRAKAYRTGEHLEPVVYEGIPD
jgi:hypothetical protein